MNIDKFIGMDSRPIKFEELTLMFHRFQIMLEEESDIYTIEEFVEQENYRRDLFPKVKKYEN